LTFVTYVTLAFPLINSVFSQGQNPKAKDEAKARTLKAEAWTLEAKTKAWTLQGQGRGLDPRPRPRPSNFKAKYDSQFNANIPHTIDMTIAPIS